jgi:hypothetical protein
MPEPAPPPVQVADATTVEFEIAITPQIVVPEFEIRPLPIPEPIVETEDE